MSEYISLFKNTSTENLFLEKYDVCLKQWPVPYESEYIDTEFGQTHVIKCGNKKAPVMVLLHGVGGTSAMWIPNIKMLSDKYYLIAVDIPGDPNKSKMKKTFKNIKGASEWLIDVINKLKIEKFSVMGTSYGSFFSMILAIHEQQRVEKLVILSPTTSFTTVKKELWFLILKNLLFSSDSNRMKCLRWFNAGKPLLMNKDFTDLQILGMKDRSLKMTTLVHLFSDEELLRITMPVLLLIGNKEVVTNIEEVKKRAEKSIKNLTFRIIDDASHTLSIDKHEIINPIIQDFLNN